MKIKKTTFIETFDDRGCLIKRVRQTQITDLRDQDECLCSERSGYDGIPRTSSRRIREAVEDYRRTKEW